MMNQIHLLQYILSHNNELLWEGYTYKQLLYDISILQYKLSPEETLSIKNVNKKNTCIMLLYSFFFNKDIYFDSDKASAYTDKEVYTLLHSSLTDLDKDNLEKQLETSFLDNGELSNIIIDKNKQVNWKEILIFSKDIRNRYNYLIDQKTHIYIENFNKIYFIYFILYPILTLKPLIFNDTIDSLTIRDFHTHKKSNILITTKYTNNKELEADHSIFYNYTIQQFLIHSTKIKQNYMLGKLYPYINIKDNNMYYKDLVLEIPPSYILKDNILFIKKKIKKSKAKQINNSIYHNKHKTKQYKKQYKKNIKEFHSINNNEHTYMINHHNHNIIAINISGIETLLTKDISTQIFNYIITKHSYTQTIIKQLYNLFLYNHIGNHNDFLNNSYFSMHFVIQSKKIIISYSQIIHKYINNILLELDSILTKDVLQSIFYKNNLSSSSIVEKMWLQTNIFHTNNEQPIYKSMDITQFLNRFGCFSIKKLSIYYYKYKTNIWSLNDINTLISYSKHNKKILPFGYHFITELDLDFGISIIIEFTSKLRFYIKQYRNKHYKDNNITLTLLDTYNNIPLHKNSIGLFSHMYNKNKEFTIFYPLTNNCGHFQLCIVQYLLDNQMNEYILLKNKLKHSLDEKYMLSKLYKLYKQKGIALQLLQPFIKNYSTKYFNYQLINKDILFNINKICIKKKKILNTLPTDNISLLLLNNDIETYSNNFILNREIIHIKDNIKYLISYVVYFIIGYIKNNSKHKKKLIHTTNKENVRQQLKYIMTKDELQYIEIIAKKLNTTPSKVIYLFLLKIFLIYFKECYFIIQKKQNRYIIPSIKNDIQLPNLLKFMNLFVNNTSLHHKIYRMFYNTLSQKGYYIHPKEKGISIQEIELHTPLQNIKVEKMYSNTTSKTNPIDITFMRIQNTYEINISYNSEYTIIKKIIKEMFIIMEIYALQEGC